MQSFGTGLDLVFESMVSTWAVLIVSLEVSAGVLETSKQEKSIADSSRESEQVVIEVIFVLFCIFIICACWSIVLL